MASGPFGKDHIGSIIKQTIDTISGAGITYTVPEDCWMNMIIIQPTNDARTAQVYVNEVVVGRIGGLNTSTPIDFGYTIPVFKGDVVTTRSGVGSYTLTFYKMGGGNRKVTPCNVAQVAA